MDPSGFAIPTVSHFSESFQGMIKGGRECAKSAGNPRDQNRSHGYNAGLKNNFIGQLNPVQKGQKPTGHYLT